MRVTKAIKAEQLKLLQEHYFDAKPALEYTNEFELLVAVVLSAQCTDERVNIVTKRLFPEHLSDSSRTIPRGSATGV